MRSSEGPRVHYPTIFTQVIRPNTPDLPARICACAWIGSIAELRSPVASGNIPHSTLGTGKGSAEVLGISVDKFVTD